MKILGVVPSRHYSEKDRFIVELELHEIQEIVAGSASGGLSFHPGMEVKIHEKWNHAMAVIEQAKKAVKLPDSLRAIADCLSIVVPQVEDVVAEPAEAEDDDESDGTGAFRAAP